MQIYCVEGFGHVECYCDGSLGGFFLVEAMGYGGVNLVKGSGGGVFGLEAVLEVEGGYVCCYVW